MKKITLRLTDEAAMKVTESAEKAGLSLNAYIVASAVSHASDDKLVSRVTAQISAARDEEKL